MHHRLLLAVLARILELQRHELVGGSTIEIDAIDSGHATFHVNWLSWEINMDALFHDPHFSAQSPRFPLDTCSVDDITATGQHNHTLQRYILENTLRLRYHADCCPPSSVGINQLALVDTYQCIQRLVCTGRILLYFSPTVLFLSSYEEAQAARHSPCLLESNHVIVVVPIEPFKLGRILRTDWRRYENIA